jgi:PAS domain S-box-containing protein
MAMTDGVVCHSASGEITAVNPAAERIHGRSARQMLGMTPDAPDWQAIHENGTPFAGDEHPAMRTLRTGEPLSDIVMGICRPDGTRVWISIDSQPLVAAGESRPYAVLTTFHDISARVLAEQEFRRLNVRLQKRVAELEQQLEAADKDLESFSYSVSHDLRAPLRAIDNFSSILHKEYGDKLDAEGSRLIAVVRRNAARMGALIKDILAFAHAGDRDLILADIDLEALSRDVLEELTPSFAGRDVSVQMQALPHIRADTAVIRKVLLNLLANAIKFTRPREVARIEIHGHVTGDEVICSVKDNGVGFEPEYGHKLFGIFERLHDAEQFEGTGIGLGIVKRSIDKHGGRVWAEGSPDVGATFYFSLPGGSGVHHARSGTRS